MNDTFNGFVEKPRARPKDPRFSSGPCKKHPGWDLTKLISAHLGRSHRAAEPKARLKLAITRSAKLLSLPTEWKLGIVPGSDTGAFEMAMWSLLGAKAVDALVWESFSNDWAKDLKQLSLPELNIYSADYGLLPERSKINPAHDLVFVFNGTTSGVRVPDLDWIADDREGLVLCDATSAAYAMPIDYSKIDVLTWSWQKVLGSEAAHGMLALSPRAVDRLETTEPPRALPKLFRLTKNNRLNAEIFKGATINTPSMLALEDLHSALNWAESIGGHKVLLRRTQENFHALADWVEKTQWIDWLAVDVTTRSPTSMCLRIASPAFSSLTTCEQQYWIDTMVGWLAEERVAFDIANYRDAPPGFRIWGGATVDADDILKLTTWLEWAYKMAETMINKKNMQHG